MTIIPPASSDPFGILAPRRDLDHLLLRAARMLCLTLCGMKETGQRYQPYFLEFVCTVRQFNPAVVSSVPNSPFWKFYITHAD